MRAFAATATLPIQLEGWDLLEEIGQGGFARVYRARDRATGSELAVKVLKRRVRAEPDHVERFRREVFAVASISSPHVVAMYDFAVSGDDVFIAMESAEGPTLRERLEMGPLVPEEARDIAAQLCDAVFAAHAQRIVHRDLKPDNIKLVGEPAFVKVVDFGFAKLLDLERTLGLRPLTRIGTTFGTPAYMAPELIRGKKFGPPADLFAIGVIVFEMLTGMRPWDGADAHDVMRAILSYPPPRLAKVAPDLPRAAELDAFFARALAKKPEQRPKDPFDLLRLLDRALFGDVPPMKPLSIRVLESVEIDLDDL